MILLLDTHAFLWFAADDPRLSPEAKRLLSDASNALTLSVASLWEMAIKVRIGKLALDLSIPQLIESAQQRDIEILPVKSEHVVCLTELALYHRDPFDRILIAQALTEHLHIVSRDSILDRYGVPRIW